MDVPFVDYGEGKDSLLEAALRAGLHLDYAVFADSCGDLANSRLYVAAPAGWSQAFVAGALEQGALQQHIHVNDCD